MRHIKNGVMARALALALVGVLAACTDDTAATDAVASDVTQPPSAAPAPGCQAVGFGQDVLAPGCWAILASGLSGSPFAELDLPAGFSGNDAWVWVDPDKDGEWGAITLVPAGDVFPDPCTRAADPPEVGPSVADFARALAAQKVTTTTTPTPVSVDGHDGIYLKMSVPATLDVSKCRAEELIIWRTGTEEMAGAGPDQVNHYWVLDVDGQRVVLAVHTNADATKETVEKFTGIAESATFFKS